MDRLKGFFLAMIAAMLWGVSGTFGQFLFHEREISIEWLLTMRLLISGIGLLLYAQFGERSHLFEVWRDKGDALQLIVFSITGILAVQYTYFAAIKHSNAATATVLQYAGPVIIAIYLACKNRKAPTLLELAAITLAVLGTFLLVTHGNANRLSISGTALFFGIASAIALATYTLQPIRLLSKYKPSVIMGWGMLVGGIVFSFVKAPWDIEGIWDLKTYGYTVFIIIFGTLIPFQAYLTAVQMIGGQKTSLLASVEPLSAAVLAVVWLHVSFSTMDWIGSLFIISTVFLLSKGSPKEVRE
ncbi:DMT family transporter [Chryseobacterium paridis]|uniref:EamA family transporter n=1 Tax=Chryseobacterium paridis TaxID=2800328 RepID=A0ABS1FWH9_9FLAO|nr:EamA family transporter [Chryseobacterium paridis]MBK1896772.1 EamA family transporter [Chryseobacterium paridis]